MRIVQAGCGHVALTYRSAVGNITPLVSNNEKEEQQQCVLHRQSGGSRKSALRDALPHCDLYAEEASSQERSSSLSTFTLPLTVL